LDGADDWVTLPNHSAVGGNNWSFAMWVKLDADPPATAAKSGWANLGPAVAGNASYYVWYDNSHHYCALLRHTSNSAANRVTIYPSHPTPRTTWHHVAITTTPGTDGWKLYVNGEVIGAATGQSSLYFDNDLWSVGRSYDGTNNYYLDGAVADVRLYNRTLSQEDIHAIIGLATAPVDEKGLRTIVASASAWRNYADTYGNLRLPPELKLTAPLTFAIRQRRDRGRFGALGTKHFEIAVCRPGFQRHLGRGKDRLDHDADLHGSENGSARLQFARGDAGAD
jgi:hypothetical protein